MLTNTISPFLFFQLMTTARRTSNMTYEGFIQTPKGEKIPVFTYDFSIAWKPKAGSVVDATPLKFNSSTDPAAQKVINDFKTRMAGDKTPAHITQPIHMDIVE